MKFPILDRNSSVHIRWIARPIYRCKRFLERHRLKPVTDACFIPRRTLKGGAVLALDLDGVCVPWEGRGFESDHSYRFSRYDLPPGWLGSGQDSCHGKFPGWLDELSKVYRHIVWISSGGQIACFNFAKAIGYKHGTRFYYAYQIEDTHWAYDEFKVRNVLGCVEPDVPLAIVDDWMFSWDEPSLGALFARPGPTFGVATDPTIGFGRYLVDQLIEFAQHPDRPIFNQRVPLAVYVDPHLRWESADQDDPTGWPTERGKLRKTLLPEEIEYLRRCKYDYLYLPEDWEPSAK